MEMEMTENNWIDVNDRLPERKEGWEHTEQVFVRYDGIPNVAVEGYGIAYYHYRPPFQARCFIDFNDNRQPTHWMSIPPIK